MMLEGTSYLWRNGWMGYGVYSTPVGTIQLDQKCHLWYQNLDKSFKKGFAHSALCFVGNSMYQNLPENHDRRVQTHRVATSGDLAHSATNKAPLPPSTSSRSSKAATMNSSCPPITIQSQNQHADVKSSHHRELDRNCHGKLEISFIRIEKSPFSRWRRNSKVNTSSGSHRKNQTRGDKKTNKKQKTRTGMNKSASLTPVQGPSTVVCMIVT
jgi:hypothetical protein